MTALHAARALDTMRTMHRSTRSRCALLLAALLLSCTPPGKAPIYTSFDKGEIGGPCGADSDCKSGTCFTATFAGKQMASIGGYCSKTCTVDAECGGSNICANYGTTGKFCTSYCEGPANCRVGYICRPGKFCDLETFYTLDCDPKADEGFCTFPDGSSGGCFRQALGEGMAGQCIPGCTLASGCASGAGCHYYDFGHMFGADYAGDAFAGLLCFFDTITPPLPVGDPCQSDTDCASGSNCVTVAGGPLSCVQLCVDGDACTDSNMTCDLNFNPKGIVGGCSDG